MNTLARFQRLPSIDEAGLFILEVGMNIYIDLESIPDQSAGAMERIMETLAPPGNISKQESIDKWWKEKAPAAAEEKYLKTSLDGTYGNIFCLGMAIDDLDPIMLTGTEEEILTSYWQHMMDFDADCIVGHNHLKFDLPFIRHRSIINRVKPSIPFRDVRFNDNNHYDTMQAWAGFGNFVKQETLCRVLGIHIPENGIDGSEVWAAVQAARPQDVYDHCTSDVIQLREIHKRLTFGG